jgi:putative membrane protein
MNSNPDNIQLHLANERTFLQWLNTGVGIMAFGFVVVKFSFFIKQITPATSKNMAISAHEGSALIGIMLVSVGALATIMAWLRYKHIEKQLRKGVYRHTSGLITLMAAAVFLMSVVLIIYLSSASK